MTSCTRSWLTVLLLICLTVSATNARNSNLPDQDPAPTPAPTPDPEEEKAKKEKTLAEARKAAFDAKKAASDAEAAATAASLAAARAKLGLSADEAAPSATAPSGNTVAPDKATEFIETQILAEYGGRMASSALVQSLCGLNGAQPVTALTSQPIGKLIIYKADEKVGVSQYRITVAQLELLHKHYQKLMTQSVDERDDSKATAAALPLLIPAATQLVKNVADLVNLFRTETQISSQTVTVNSNFVVSSLANELLAIDNPQCKVKAIFHPAVYPLTVPKGATSAIFNAYKNLMDDVVAGDSEVIENARKVTQLTKEKNDHEAAITKLEGQIAEARNKAEEQKLPVKKSKKKPIKNLEPEEPPFDIAKAEKELKQRRAWIDDKLDPRIQRLQQSAEAIKSFKTSVTKLFEILTAVDDTTKQPIFNNLVTAERLSELLADKSTYVLTLNVKGSGTNRSRKNMFFNAKVDHSGGASIDANLFNFEDQLVFGKVEHFYVDFTKSKLIRQRGGFHQMGAK